MQTIPDGDFVKREGDNAVLDLSPRIVLNEEKLQELQNQFSRNPPKKLILNGDAAQAQSMLQMLKTRVNWTLPIELPKELQNSRTQIDLDSLIAKHLAVKKFEKIRQMARQTESVVDNTPPEGRVIPKKFTPKIEIILKKELGEQEIASQEAESELMTSTGIETPPPPLEVAPMVPQWMEGLLSQEQKTAWEGITDRAQAIEFRKNIVTSFSKENHPIVRLYPKYAAWPKTTLDAMLDVYGQYGEEGLQELVKKWESYTNDAEKGGVFQNTFESLFKSMPSFLPFLEDEKFQKTLDDITKLDKERKSWWIALVKNHGGYTDLTYLFQQFTRAMNTISKEMNLTIPIIDAIQIKKDMTTTLQAMLQRIKQCPKQDLQQQLECIHQIELPDAQDYHFIVPEMSRIGIGELESLKSQLTSEPEEVIPAFYRYVAKCAQHLPLKEYQKILKDIVQHKELNNEAKNRFIYILAKGTTADESANFIAKNVLEEWKKFLERNLELGALERMKANRNRFERNLLELGTQNKQQVRIQSIGPIMEMEVIPPMSYLNKLLMCAEYQFLDPILTIRGLMRRQAEMMEKLKTAAAFCKTHPKEIMQAVSHLKTETPLKNLDGKYFPATEDIPLLDNFIECCQTLTAPSNQQGFPAPLSPERVLLPLLTTFHLEYDKSSIPELIRSYRGKLTTSSEKLQNLLPYALSLFQYIQNRDDPERLDVHKLKTILHQLIDGINQDTLTTRKQIRDWLHQTYNQFFIQNVLLDLKDAVDFTILFEQLNCTDPVTKTQIEALVSKFDEPLEILQHETIVKSLVNFSRNLSTNQKDRFFEFCQQAFTTSGMLSRNHHPGPPPWWKQFVDLLDTLQNHSAFEEFEQYLQMVQDRPEALQDSLGKCNYLLKYPYPEMKAKGVSRKEAFQFSVAYVSITPLAELDKPHLGVEVPVPTTGSELESYRAAIEGLDVRLENITSDKLIKLQQFLDDLIHRSRKPRFKQCQELSERIETVLRAMEIRQKPPQKPEGWIPWLASFVVSPPPFVPGPTDAEFRSLQIDHDLFEKDPDILRELQELRVEEAHQFHHLVYDLYTKKTAFLNHYSNLASRAEQFLMQAMRVSPSNVAKNHQDVCLLMDNLIKLNDQNLVLGLMYHYAGGLPDRSVKELMSLLNSPNYQALPNPLQKKFFHVLLMQMNNSVRCTQTEVLAFLNFIHANKEDELTEEFLGKYYQHAPFPPLNTFMRWMESKNRATIESRYRSFDKAPFAIDGHSGRELENGFKLDVVDKILQQIPGSRKIFSPDFIESIVEQQGIARRKSTEEILATLKKFQQNPPKDFVEMVMFTAELLHRSKGRTPEFVGEDQIPGRSFELNTTQIIAILMMLQTGQKVTAEIGTGEGKTRIMMVMNACQFLQGKTVDLLTSNLALAERDYLESLPFFTSLGANVKLINAATPIEAYQMGGIHVSDPENLSLFRAKAMQLNRMNEVLDPAPQKRALVLDEADVAYFDIAHLSYNYAEKPSQQSIDLLPVYQDLMEFFALKDTETDFRDNKQLCTKKFLNFIETENPKAFETLKALSNSELEKLQEAAFQARHLEFKETYTISTDEPHPSALGTKKVAAAKCLLFSRINKNGSFPDGVHQCLHAELNRLMRLQDPPIEDPALKEALQICKQKNRRFMIEPSWEVSSSSSAYALLDSYKKGSIHAVTGTLGTNFEQLEAQSQFGTKSFKVPRHKGLHRDERPTLLLENDDRELEALKAHIDEANRKNQPTLFMCKNDRESKQLYDKLVKIYGDRRLKHVHAGTPEDEENHYIKTIAGQPGQVTISSPMEGRGADIELHGESRKSGLKVVVNYLPRSLRELVQAYGRTSRYGMIGDTQMVLNQEKLKQEYGINYLNRDFYLNPEAYMTKLQHFISHTHKIQLMFYRCFDNQLNALAERFRRNSNVEKGDWGNFLAKYKRHQTLILDKIDIELQKPLPDIPKIRQLLADHDKEIAKFWKEEVKEIGELPPLPTIKISRLLSRWLEEMENINIGFIQVEMEEKVSIREHFDPLAAGSAQIIRNPSYKDTLANIKAARSGQGVWFPTFWAWWNNKLSGYNFLSQLPFFEWFMKPKEETRKTVEFVPSSYAALLKLEKAEKSEDLMEVQEETPVNKETSVVVEEHQGDSVDQPEPGSEQSRPRI